MEGRTDARQKAVVVVAHAAEVEVPRKISQRVSQADLRDLAWHAHPHGVVDPDARSC